MDYDHNYYTFSNKRDKPFFLKMYTSNKNYNLHVSQN